MKLKRRISQMRVKVRYEASNTAMLAVLANHMYACGAGNITLEAEVEITAHSESVVKMKAANRPATRRRRTAPTTTKRNQRPFKDSLWATSLRKIIGNYKKASGKPVVYMAEQMGIPAASLTAYKGGYYRPSMEVRKKLDKWTALSSSGMIDWSDLDR